jgi:DNA-binding response OmpR family regulator
MIDPEMAKEGIGKTVLVIESRVELQNLLREKLKSRGYRVLVFSNPQTAMARFAPDEPSAADCIVISAVDLGSEALDAFNKLSEQPFTAKMPAVMLVDPKQDYIVRGAKTSDKHILLPMPLKVRDLRNALSTLIVAPVSQ